MKKYFSKKRMILLVVWIGITVFYLFNAFDNARSTSGMIELGISNAIESASGYYADDNGAAAMVSMLSLSDKMESVKSNMRLDAIFNVIYIVSTVIIYHIGFRKKEC